MNICRYFYLMNIYVTTFKQGLKGSKMVKINTCTWFDSRGRLIFLSGEGTDGLLPPANEVWGKVIFSVACVKNSVHRGGSASVHAGIPHTPGADPPVTRHTSPCAVHARIYGQQAGGMHRTGMQSCHSPATNLQYDQTGKLATFCVGNDSSYL